MKAIKSINLFILALLCQVVFAQNNDIVKSFDLRMDKSAKKGLDSANIAKALKIQFEISENYEFKRQVIKGTKDKMSEKDDLGYVHERYAQYYNGIKIENSDIRVHYLNGLFVSANGEYIDAPNIDVSVILSKEDAIQKAKEYIGAEEYIWENEAENNWLKSITNDETASFYPNPEIVICRNSIDFQDTIFHIAYKMDIYAKNPIRRDYIFVDAKDGRILAVNPILVNVIGTAATRYSGTRSISTQQNGSTYRLRGYDNNRSVETYNMNKGTNYGTATDFTDNDNNWTAAEYHNANKDDGALDAHWATMMTYDYFKNIHNRNSYDNNGAVLKSYVHYSTNYDNAFWNGLCMTYGDGYTAFDILTTLDVTAHEIGHGVCTYSANLVYSGESGAINESLSDIWGACVENWATTNKQTWLIGEDITLSYPCLRNMQDPGSTTLPSSWRQPDTYGGGPYWTGPYADVHTNSGIMNHWFYILSIGKSGTNGIGNAYNVTGIGISKAEKITYRAETVYMTANTNFADARTRTIQATIDLYGVCSPEEVSVTNAWYAVGVGNQIVTIQIMSNYISCNSIKVEWGNVPNAISYILDYSTDPDFTTFNTCTLNTTSQILSWLTSGTYYFRVKAYNSAGDWVGYGTASFEYQTIDPDTEGILYVRKGSVGDGSSWSSALGELSDAIAATNICNIQEIWVSAGTYYPTSTTDRNISFVLPSNVKVFGGFPDTGDPAWGDRDWVNNPTILSGDIGIANVMTDNSFTVVTAGNNSHLDGFSITCGYGASLGSGILVSGSAELQNLRIYQNYANQAGGIAITGGSPSLSHSVIYSNTAQLEGGGMGIFSGTPYIDSIAIYSNSASSGGGLAIISGTPYFDSLAIYSNNAQTSGGGVTVLNGMPHFKRIHLHHNQVQQSGGGLAVLGGGCTDIEVAYIYKNHANHEGGGIFIESQRTRGGTTPDTSLFVENEEANTRDLERPETRLFAKYLNIFKNHSNNRGGGIACVSYPFTPSIMPVFENVAIHGNHAMNEGGGVLNDNSGILFLNPLFYDNNSGGQGTEIMEHTNSSYIILVHATITKTYQPSTMQDIVTHGQLYLYNSIVCLNGFSPQLPPFLGDNYIVNGSCSNLFVNPAIGNYSLAPHALPPIRPFDISMVINNIYPYGGPSQLFCGRSPGELLVRDMDGRPRVFAGMSNYGAYEEVDSSFTHWHPFWKSADNAEDKEEDLLQEGSGWKLQAYPNPTLSGQQLSISLANGNIVYENSVYLRLFSIEGSLLLEETYPRGKFTTAVPPLAPGIYVIRLRTEDGTIYTAKLVVMK